MKRENRAGFSLLELLIYIAILTIATLIIAGTFISINRGSSQTEARSDVNGNLRFAIERISQDIRAATAIATPTTTATAFDGDGVVQTDPSVTNDEAYGVSADSSYLYIVGMQGTGGGCITGGNCWRIEKRDKTTGALVSAFGTSGATTTDPTSGTDEALGIVTDSSYIYVTGYQATGGGCTAGGSCWRIEKRDKTTGALVTAFDGDGIAQSDSSGTDVSYAIAIDSAYIYIAGYQGADCGNPASFCWRIEKRDKTTGALVTAFNSGGFVLSNPTNSNDVARAIAVDANYVYIAGYQGTGCAQGLQCWRIEKRDITSGALVNAFDTDGVVQSDPTTDDDVIFGLTIDSSYIYSAGFQASGCSNGLECWRIEKRDITSGALVNAFDTDGVVQSDPTTGTDAARAIIADTSYLYTVGGQANAAGCSAGSDCWRVEKRNIATGALVSAFDGDGVVLSDPSTGADLARAVVLDPTFIYTIGYQATGSGCATGGNCWRMEKRFLSDGALATGTYGDTTSTLVMTVSGSAVTYCVANGQLRRHVGGGACGTSSEAITADTVSISNPLFTRLTNTNITLGKSIVSIEMSLTTSASSTNPDAQFTSTKKATASMR